MLMVTTVPFWPLSLYLAGNHPLTDLSVRQGMPIYRVMVGFGDSVYTLFTTMDIEFDFIVFKSKFSLL
jgi:hypothetical protein